MVAKAYHKHKHKVLDKHAYLYDGIQTLNDYRRLYCAKEMKNAACNEEQSIDNGTLTQRFERFVDDYDGRDPFDVHLNLQVTQLLDGRNGQPLPVSILYNASDAEMGWRDIADSKGVKIPKDGLEVGRKTTRRFNLELVSNATKQKICRLVALDYCCLNIELPEVCRMDEDEGVHCAMEKKYHLGKDVRRKKQHKLFIEPWENA